jgi:hypothetical protein
MDLVILKTLSLIGSDTSSCSHYPKTLALNCMSVILYHRFRVMPLSVRSFPPVAARFRSVPPIAAHCRSGRASPLANDPSGPP